MNEKGVMRIIDANLNRTCEGLRVLEDIARFTFNNKELTLRLKEERHSLRKLFLDEVDNAIIERDAKIDVGRVPSRFEDRRRDLSEIATCNLKRVEESLRTLEEVCKLFALKKAHRIKRMRFAFYSIEKNIDELFLSRKGLKKEGIYIVLPDGNRKKVLSIVRAIVDEPVAAVQLRSKKFSTAELMKVARSIRTITAKKDITFIVNDRVALALAVNADGVHIGQDDMPIKDVRKLTGFRFTIGVSTHSLEEAKRAEKDGADYVAFGSIYPTNSKVNAVVQGTAMLKKLCSKAALPVVAIGGINDKNIKAVSSAGANYAAVVSYVSDARDYGAAVRKLYRNFVKGTTRLHKKKDRYRLR